MPEHSLPDRLVLSIRLQPRASRDEICGRYGDAIKIRITAPPVDGRANAHLIRFLASVFAVPQASVRIVSGTRGRNKKIEITRPARIPEQISKAQHTDRE